MTLEEERSRRSRLNEGSWDGLQPRPKLRIRRRSTTRSEHDSDLFVLLLAETACGAREVGADPCVHGIGI